MADYILRVYTDFLTEKATLSSALPGGILVSISPTV